ncbi:MAG: glycosyltransferase [Candidatus Nanopusillus acidilobi]
MKDNNTGTKQMIFFWPDGIFEDVHIKKDPGSIPIGFFKLGYNVTIMVIKMNATNLPGDINIIQLFPTLSYKSIKDMHKIDKILFNLIESMKAFKVFIRKDPDLILVEHEPLSALFSVATYRLLCKIIFRNSRKKFIIKQDVNSEDIKNIHQNKNIISIFEDIWQLLYSIVFDIIIVESDCAYNELLKSPFSEMLRKKLRIVPNGYANPKVENENPKRGKIILSVGRIHPQKGHDVLISSFKKVYFIHKDWELRIIGPIEDLEYYEKLKILIDELKLNDSVKLLGNVDEKTLEEEYKKASIFCLLSRYEGFPIARLEAMSYGLPVITTKAGCGEQYSKYGSIIVPIEDTERPAEAMLKLIENPGLRIEISKKQMDAVYSWDDVVKKIYDLL